jgi:nucleotide-binding universal stress UspA family protein
LFASIVVGTDGSETAREAVRQAVELAARLGARLEIVSAWTIDAREDVDATLREAATVAAAAGVPAETHARQGDAADAILDVAEERGAALVVVGNRGRTGARRFLLGSVPNRVSHHAPCSVLIIRTT